MNLKGQNSKRNLGLPELLENFFKNEALFKDYADLKLLVLRKDGQVIYTKGYVEQDASNVSLTLGALIAGISQAVEGLSEELNFKKDGGRLTLQLGDSGLELTPVYLPMEALYLALIYAKQDNPGRLRFKFWSITERLFFYFKQLDSPDFLELNKVKRSEEKLNSESDTLFEQISDEEMDKLFYFAGS